MTTAVRSNRPVRAATIALAWLLAAAPAAAQGIEFGVKGGVNFATLDFDEFEDEDEPPIDYRIGLAVGGYFVMPLTGRLSLQPEALYMQKGAAFGDSDVVSARFELDYVEIPVLVRYGFGDIHVFGGPSFGVKVRARSVVEFEDESEEQDLGDDVESLDFGLAVGAGWQRGRLSVDGRYMFGLSNINAVDRDDVTIKTRGIALMAGWRF